MPACPASSEHSVCWDIEVVGGLVSIVRRLRHCPPTGLQLAPAPGANLGNHPHPRPRPQHSHAAFARIARLIPCRPALQHLGPAHPATSHPVAILNSSAARAGATREEELRADNNILIHNSQLWHPSGELETELVCPRCGPFPSQPLPLNKRSTCHAATSRATTLTPFLSVIFNTPTSILLPSILPSPPSSSTS